MDLAPVAVFAYRRPEHTARLLASLFANPEARNSHVFVFADGARAEADAAGVAATRAAVRSAFPRVTLVERDRNWGLARNIIDGVSHLCREHGRVIVLEDDLIISDTFLAYMNDALHVYRDSDKVLHVSGYMYPIDLPSSSDAIFLPFINSTGWATWARAWAHFDPEASAYKSLQSDKRLRRRFDLDGCYGYHAMLDAQVNGRIDSWAIRWYLSVFSRQGLALFPTKSLVQNEGVGVGATHTEGDSGSPLLQGIAHPIRIQRFPATLAVDEPSYRRIKAFMGKERSIFKRVLRRLRRSYLGRRPTRT